MKSQPEHLKVQWALLCLGPRRMQSIEPELTFASIVKIDDVTMLKLMTSQKDNLNLFQT